MKHMKPMKKMKRLLGVLLAAIMVLAFGVTVSAANITIGGSANGASYSAYRLLNATDGGSDKFAYTLNEKYTAILEKVTQKFTETEIVKYISELDRSGTRDFADDVYAKIKENSVEADATTNNNQFTGVAQGYYLIVETATGGDQDSYSLVMLDTAGNSNITVTPKEDEPTLEKQIKHNETGDWGVVGDNQIGDTVEFRTITTVPDYTADYENYTYTIHDTMSVGLTSNVITGNTNGDVKVKVNNATDLAAKYITVTATGNKFTVAIDVKTAVSENAMAVGDKLYTYYTGVLNNNALIYDEGKQDNTAYLEYSNNPYDTDDKTQTPNDVVYDWTYEMGVNKVDGSTQATINGAIFVLSEIGTLDLDSLGLNNGVPTNTDDLIGLVNEGSGVYRVATATDSDVVYHIEAGNITIEGLDDETSYYLYETKAPDGYNALQDPVTFKISTSYEADGSDYAEGSPTVTVGEGQASTTLSTDIKNNSGTELPETGGIGTTIFYVVGGILVIGAAVLLITRRRMNK